MSSFKAYRQTKKVAPVVAIQETTVPDHLQHISENWDHHSQVSDDTHAKMHEAMGGVGKSFTTFPLVGHTHADVDADVAEHLTKHNYQIKDYSKGIATIKKQVGDPSKGIPMREKMVDEKIGSVLDKTGAHDDVKKAFINDPARTSNKNFVPGAAGHHVVITHGALGISGMSTGTSWHDQSCMDQGRSTGYNHKLEDDSQHGTHVAYLVHHDDVNAFKYGEPDKPIARIALKPFHEEEDNHHSDTIFRPENKTYGSGNTGFEKAVGNWSVAKYPAKAGVEYTKNSNVYDDTGNTHYKSVSKEDAEESIKASMSCVDTKGAAVDKDVIDHVMAMGKKHLAQFDPANGTAHAFQTKEFIKNTAEIGNLNTQHVAALHAMAKDNAQKMGDHTALATLGREHGDKFSTNAINHHIDTFGATSLPNRMLMNPKLPASVVDQLPTDDYKHVRRSLLKPHHYDKVVDNYVDNKSGSSYDLDDHAQHLTEGHLDKLVGMGFRSGILGAAHVVMSNKNFNQSHHDKLMNTIIANGDGSGSVAAKHNILRNSKFTTVGDAEKISSYDGLSGLSNNKHISSETQKAIKDKFIGAASLDSKNVYGINGFGVLGTYGLPSNISKHLTPDDHKTLAESGKNFHFESPEHSAKHLDVHKSLVSKADDELGHHIDKQTKHHEDNDLDEYDHTDGDDDHANHLVEKLHNHVANYARAIDNHIDLHVADGRGSEEYTKDFTHHEKIDDHLEHIDNLTHYKTENNSRSFEDKDHFYGHVQDIHDRMSKIKKNDEYRENHDWD